jgi:hypothetical protein
MTDNIGDTFTANSRLAVNYSFLDVDSDNDGISDDSKPKVRRTTRLAKASQTSLPTRTRTACDAYDPNNGGTAIGLDGHR